MSSGVITDRVRPRQSGKAWGVGFFFDLKQGESRQAGVAEAAFRWLTATDSGTHRRRPVRLALLCLLLPALAVGAGLEPLRDAWRSGDVVAVERGLRPLAESGDARAQLLLGHLYQTGRGGAVDYPAALHWFRRAADQGVAEAQYALGLMYELGYGTEVDAAEAEYWYGRAVAHGLCPGELDIDAYWNEPGPLPPIVD